MLFRLSAGLSPWLLQATLLFLALPAWSQANNDNSLSFEAAEPAFESQWYLGGTYRLDNIGHRIEQGVGMQLFHRMEPSFGTGGGILFLPTDSSFEVNLDARWIWPLPVIEPYLGAQIGYLTRSTGGVSLALRPGIMLEVPRLPLMFELYSLARYDLFGVVFGGEAVQSPFLLGFGLALSYRL